MAAALAIPQPAGPGRISQLLPSVKCSSCNEPVPLAELGEHICGPVSLSSANSPGRMVSPGPKQANSPPASIRGSTRTSFSTMRTRSTSSASSTYTDVPSAHLPAYSALPPLPTTAPPSQLEFPTSPPKPSFVRERNNSNASQFSRSIQAQTPPPSHFPRSPPPPRSPAPSTRSPVAAGSYFPPSVFAGACSSFRTPRSPGFVPQQAPDPRMSSTPYIISTHSPRPPPLASPAPGIRPPGSPAPRYNSPTNSHHPSSPSFPTSPLLTSPTWPSSPRPHHVSPGSPAPGNVPAIAASYQTRSDMPRSPEPDTKIGGEAGMAGVGRRGFAAFANAALFISKAQGEPGPVHPGMPMTPPTPWHQPSAPGNRPQFLDMAAIHKAAGLSGTPPLKSPGASTISPPSPHSPASPSSPRTPGATTPTTRVETFSTEIFDGLSDSGLSASQTEEDDDDHKSTLKHLRDLSITTDGSEVGLAYAQSTDLEDEDLQDFVSRADSVRASRIFSRSRHRKDSNTSTSSGSSSGRGLPTRKDSYGTPGEGEIPPLPTSSRKDLELEIAFNAVAALSEPMTPTSPIFPAPKTPLRSNTVQGYAPKQDVDPFDSLMAKLPMRSNTERVSSRDVTGLNFDKGKSRTKVCVGCTKKIDDGRWIQIDGEEGAKVKGKGVLCDSCWKGMYLPKCRRCQLPIEKQAVSSSDGQLKGKYHKHCFNCFECGTEFQNKTFYVFNEQALCAYHYALHNRSLCSSSTCGQPIEGPCAEDHRGGRYHPEHFVCERDGCQERLDKEYWEVEGKMVCERHGQMSFRQSRMWGVGSRKSRARSWGLSLYGAEGVYEGVEELDEDDVSKYDSDEFDENSPEWTAMKRTTRFIDLRQSTIDLK